MVHSRDQPHDALASREGRRSRRGTHRQAHAHFPRVSGGLHHSSLKSWGEVLSGQADWVRQAQVRTEIFELVKAARLDAAHAFILLRLMENTEWDSGHGTHPGLKILADDSHVSARTVLEALRRARRFGLIEKIKDRRNAGRNLRGFQFRFLIDNHSPSNTRHLQSGSDRRGRVVSCATSATAPRSEAQGE